MQLLKLLDADVVLDVELQLELEMEQSELQLVVEPGAELVVEL